MATMKKPTVQGDYRSTPVNQGGPQGALEDRVIATGGQSPLGNVLARNVGPGGAGTGRDVYRSGGVMEHGPPNPGNPTKAPRDNDVMSD